MAVSIAQPLTIRDTKYCNANPHTTYPTVTRLRWFISLRYLHRHDSKTLQTRRTSLLEVIPCYHYAVSLPSRSSFDVTFLLCIHDHGLPRRRWTFVKDVRWCTIKILLNMLSLRVFMRVLTAIVWSQIHDFCRAAKEVDTRSMVCNRPNATVVYMTNTGRTFIDDGRLVALTLILQTCNARFG